MKVLELTGEPILSGGQESFIFNVIKHIRKKDLQIDVLTLYNCENNYYRSIVEGIGGKVITFNLPFNPGGLRCNMFLPLLRFLRVNKYDVIHIHSGSITVLAIGALAARLSGIKNIIVHSHSTGKIKNFKYRILKLFSFPFLEWIPNHYCACSYEAGLWKFPKNIADKKLQVIDNGIDLDVFSPNEEIRIEMRKELGIQDSTSVLGHVGRFSPPKNHSFIINIFNEYQKKHSDSKLLLVGEGELYEDINELVAKLGLKDKVIMPGATSKVADYMQTMDLFLFPSLWEGLGLVAVEAQGIGMPVIASTNVPRLMKIADEVIFLDLDKKQEWINAIERLINGERKANREKLRKAGFDINQTAEEIRKIYFQN